MIRIGFIGAGWITEKAHIPAFQALGEKVQIVSLLDADANRCKILAEQYRIPHSFDREEDFLASNIHAVVIASPNNTHTHYSNLMLSHGIHVLCEKPVALSRQEVLQTVKLAQAQKRVFMPGFVNRYRQDVNRFQELVRRKDLGQITQISGSWLRRSGIPRPGTWITNQNYAGGGVLTDLGSHMLDLCLRFLPAGSQLNQAILTVQGLQRALNREADWCKMGNTPNLPVDVEISAQGLLTHSPKSTVRVDLSWDAEVEYDVTRLKLTGSKGSAQLDTLFGFSPIPREASYSVHFYDDRGKLTHDEAVHPEGLAMEAFQKQAEHFLYQIEHGQSNAELLSAGSVVSVTEKLYRSLKIKGENRGG